MKKLSVTALTLALAAPAFAAPVEPASAANEHKPAKIQAKHQKHKAAPTPAPRQ